MLIFEFVLAAIAAIAATWLGWHGGNWLLARLMP